MVEIKVTHPDVESAERVVWGAMAQAQALVQVMDGSEDESPFLTLARNALEGLTMAFDLYQTELVRYGVGSLVERTGGVIGGCEFIPHRGMYAKRNGGRDTRPTNAR